MKNRRFFVLSVLAVLLLLGSLVTSFISYYVASDSLSTQAAKDTLPLTSDNIYSEIQRDLLRPIFISSLMAQDTFVRDWVIDGEKDEQSIIRYLSEIKERYKTITSFFVSESTRKYYHASGVLKKISKNDPIDKWYFRVRELKQDYEINVDTDTATRTSLTIFINYRVYDYKGNYIGVIGVGLALEAVKMLINSYQERYQRQIFFTDKKGQVTLRSVNYQGPNSIYEIPGLGSHVEHILAHPNSAVEYSHKGKTTFLNSRFVPEFNWYLMVRQQDDPTSERILNTLMVNVFVSLVMTIIILVLVWLTLGAYQKKLESMASTDKLTGASNRQVFEVLFQQAFKSARRRKASLSVIMFDLDHFKQVNDSYGHPTGDVVLKNVAQQTAKLVRDSDVLFRWGGEEFLLLLPDCDLQQTAALAEKIRQNIEANAILFNGKSIYVTASFGLAELSEEESGEALLQRVDKALYQAKDKGRNRVEVIS